MCTGALKKPWTLQKHGDLMELLLKFIIANTPTSLAGTKFKGRSTQKDIKNGKCTVNGAFGDQRAGTSATAGILQTPKPPHRSPNASLADTKLIANSSKAYTTSSSP